MAKENPRSFGQNVTRHEGEGIRGSEIVGNDSTAHRFLVLWAVR